MPRIAIVTSNLLPGDAVSNDVLGMSEAFAKRGVESRVYSDNSGAAAPNVFDLADVHEFVAGPSDLLVYHHVGPWEAGLSLLGRAKCRKAIKWHNLGLPRAAESGELSDELKQIDQFNCDLYLADSEYGRGELLLEGIDARKCFVVPSFHDIDRLRLAETNLETLDRYRDGSVNFVTAGPIAPYENQDQLILAFAIYLHHHNPNSRLFILGKENAAFGDYSQRLRDLVVFLAIDDAVSFLGELTVSERKAYYLVSRALAIASEHEGLHLGVLEAMSLKVPVIARASSAISATLGEAGILLDEQDPSFMAEAMNCLSTDEALSFEFALLGCRRYERQFTNQQIERELFDALKNDVPGMHHV